MPRISRNDVCMLVAAAFAERSTCERKKVGAAIALEGRILSTGYANPPAGLPHCSPGLCDLSQPCDRTVHAEANAIAFAARHGIAIEGSTLYVTCSPCINCAKLIINAGIKTVIYCEEYRDPAPLDLLTQAGIEHWQMNISYKL